MAFAHSVPVEDDAGGFELSTAVELHQQILDHEGQVLYDLLAMLLYTHGGAVSGRMGVHGSYDGGNARLGTIAGRRVGDIGSQEDHGLAEYVGSVEIGGERRGEVMGKGKEVM